MKITATAISLNVADVPASSRFLCEHFGFSEAMAADGFASLVREDVGASVVFLRCGLATLPDDQRDAFVAARRAGATDAATRAGTQSPLRVGT